MNLILSQFKITDQTSSTLSFPTKYYFLTRTKTFLISVRMPLFSSSQFFHHHPINLDPQFFVISHEMRRPEVRYDSEKLCDLILTDIYSDSAFRVGRHICQKRDFLGAGIVGGI